MTTNCKIQPATEERLFIKANTTVRSDYECDRVVAIHIDRGRRRSGRILPAGVLGYGDVRICIWHLSLLFIFILLRSVGLETRVGHKILQVGFSHDSLKLIAFL